MITNTWPKCGTPSGPPPAADGCTSVPSPMIRTAAARRRRTRIAGRSCKRRELRASSVVETELPLAPREHREDLAFAWLSIKHVAHGLRARLPRRQTRPPSDLSENTPLLRPELLQDHVPAG